MPSGSISTTIPIDKMPTHPNIPTNSIMIPAPTFLKLPMDPKFQQKLQAPQEGNTILKRGDWCAPEFQSQSIVARKE